jgi:hypothetical protein
VERGDGKMTKEEFERRIGNQVTQEEYDEIEMVYNFHPAISNTDGKNEVAALHKLGVIPDLVARAERAKGIEAEISCVKGAIADYQETLQLLYEKLQKV